MKFHLHEGLRLRNAVKKSCENKTFKVTKNVKPTKPKIGLQISTNFLPIVVSFPLFFWTFPTTWVFRKSNIAIIRVMFQSFARKSCFKKNIFSDSIEAFSKCDYLT